MKHGQTIVLKKIGYQVFSAWLGYVEDREGDVKWNPDKGIFECSKTQKYKTKGTKKVGMMKLK